MIHTKHLLLFVKPIKIPPGKNGFYVLNNIVNRKCVDVEHTLNTRFNVVVIAFNIDWIFFFFLSFKFCKRDWSVNSLWLWKYSSYTNLKLTSIHMLTSVFWKWCVGRRRLTIFVTFWSKNINLLSSMSSLNRLLLLLTCVPFKIQSFRVYFLSGV